MNIEIRDPVLQARLQKQVAATGSASFEEALERLLETQEEQDRWLSENSEINAKIRRGLDQLDRGEGIPEDQLHSHLAKLKSKPSGLPGTSSRHKRRRISLKSGVTFEGKAVPRWQIAWNPRFCKE
jgi:hypothetical protein